MVVCFGNVVLILLALDIAHRRAVLSTATKLRIEQKAINTFGEPSVRLHSMKDLGNYRRTHR